MKLMQRIIFSILLFGGIAAAGFVFSAQGYLISGISMIFCAWMLIRDYYLSRSKLEFDENSIIVINNKNKKKEIFYDEICRVQKIGPNIRILFFHLKERPSSPRLVNDELRYINIPEGGEMLDALRRTLTISTDLLIQSRSGKTLLIPLASIDSSRKRDLWTHLILKINPVLFRQDNGSIERAITEDETGSNLKENRKYSEALKHFQVATSIWEENGYMKYAAGSIQQSVDCLLCLGRFSEAGGLASKALNLANNLDDKNKQANSLNHLAAIEREIGGIEGLKRALDYLEEAKNRFADLKLPFFECRMISNQSIVLEKLFNYTEEKCYLDMCQGHAEEALRLLPTKLRREQNKFIKVLEASLLGTLARCRYYSEDWNGALSLFNEAHNIGLAPGESINISDHAMWGRVLFKVSQIDSFPQPNKESLRLLHQALTTLDNAMAKSQSSGDFSSAIEVHMLRGDTYWEMGNNQAAINDYELVISILESSRFSFARPFDRLSLLRQYRKIYNRTIEALLYESENDPNHRSELAEKAFQHCERNRARNLADRLNLSALLFQKMPEDLKTKLDAAVQDLQSAYLQVETLQKETQNYESSNFLNAWEQLQISQQKYEHIVEEASQSLPEFSELISPKVPSLSEVHSWLPEDGSGAVVEFSIGEKGLCVFFINKQAEAQNYFIIETLDRKELEKKFLLTGWLREYENHSTDYGWKELLPDLIKLIEDSIVNEPGSYGWSIRDLLDRHEIKRLVIVPDGILHRLPIHSAIDHKIDVTYAPSAAVLIQTISKSKEVPDKVLFINPKCLQEADYEVRLLEEKFKGEEFVVSKLEGKDATAGAIISNMRIHSLYHFSGHAESNFESPFDSFLLAAGCDEKVGSLSAKEIMIEGAFRPGAWIVLGACETGIAPTDPSGEYLGLPAAFLAAGASIVISTLWKVHAGTPLIIFDHFYENIITRGLSASAALREACNVLHEIKMTDIRDFEISNSLPHGIVLTSDEAKIFPLLNPIHWAPFIVYGAAWLNNEVSRNKSEIGSHRQLLPELTSNIGFGSSPKLKKALDEIDEIINQKRLILAASMLEKTLKDFGKTRSLLDRLSGVYAYLEDFNKSENYYHEIIKLDPNCSANYYNLGCLYMDFGLIAGARASFQHALQLDPAYANAMINLTNLTNNPNEALNYLNKALSIEPNDVDAIGLKERWQDLLSNKEVDIKLQRLAWSQQALDRNDIHGVRLNIGMAMEENLDKIEKAFVLRIESDVLKKEGRIRDSIPMLESAIKLDPNQPAYWNTLATRRISILNSPETSQSERFSLMNSAEEELLEAIKLGDYAKPHQNLAIIYNNLGVIDKAIKNAILARDMAENQMKFGTNKIICKGCSTQGEMPNECKNCLREIHLTLRDIEFASGNYKM